MVQLTSSRKGFTVQPIQGANTAIDVNELRWFEASAFDFLPFERTWLILRPQSLIIQFPKLHRPYIF